MKTKAQKRTEERKRQEAIKAQRKATRLARQKLLESSGPAKGKKGKSQIPKSKARKR